MTLSTASTGCSVNGTAGACALVPVGTAAAADLNRDCFCIGLDRAALREALERQSHDPGLFDLLAERCPHVFAANPVFVPAADGQRMQQLVEAIESVVALPAYREAALSRAPAIARHDPRGPLGVFLGYDFHLGAGSFGLIEINTNAGGAMLNALLGRAQRACCAALDGLVAPAATSDALEAAIVDMFRNEWRLRGNGRVLRRIAIVDVAATQQYLYPEFLLFQQLFRRHGIDALIASPGDLHLEGGVLRAGGLAIDLVYNRLTDFALEDEASAALRQAYLEDAIVLTPHPRAHALYADKRNLIVLSDGDALRELGVPAETRAILLAGIPRTRTVSALDAGGLWAARRQLFFKPSAGYGGRAAYRGDKVTSRVWQEILAGGYVAQALVTPGERSVAGDERAFKFDLRNYVYDGRVQSLAARTYQGQTTNFRTPGGGFAPVYLIAPDADVALASAPPSPGLMEAVAD